MALLSSTWFQLTLAAATLLGGASAIWYFRSELISWLRRKLEIKAPLEAAPQPHAADRSLFEKILEFMPFEPVGRFLQEHNFAGSFHIREWAGIHDYMRFADSPECRFQDSALEALRQKLTAALLQFLRASDGNVWSAHKEDWMGVPDEWDFRDNPRYGDFWPAVKELNTRARAAYEEYELFVRKGRSVLLRH